MAAEPKLTGPFPTRVVRPRLQKPMTLPLVEGIEGEPSAVLETPNGLLVAWSNGLSLFDPADCHPLAQWNSSTGTMLAAQPFSRQDIGPVVSDGRSVFWLYPTTHKPRSEWQPADGGAITALAFAEDNQIWIAQDGSAGQQPRLLRLSDQGDELEEIPLDAAPISIAVMKDGLAVALQSVVAFINLRGSELSVSVIRFPEPVDRLWPSPDNRYLMATGDGAHHAVLLRVTGDADKPLVQRLSMAHVPYAEDHPGGWVFWNREIPHMPEPQPLQTPTVVWEANGLFAIVGSIQALGAVVDPESARGMKIMVPPESKFIPLRLEAPNRIHFVDGHQLGRYELNWDWTLPSKNGEEQPVMADKPTPAPALPQSSAEAPRWLPLVLAAAVVVGLALYWWLWK